MDLDEKISKKSVFKQLKLNLLQISLGGHKGSFPKLNCVLVIPNHIHMIAKKEKNPQIKMSPFLKISH